MTSDPIVVLGTGMAGLGAATVLRESGAPFLVLDRATRPGGHTITHHHPAGFLFDDGPHVSFTKDERIRRILNETVAGRANGTSRRTSTTTGADGASHIRSSSTCTHCPRTW